MSLCFLILSLTQDIYSDVYSRILNFIQISNWTYSNIKSTCSTFFCLDRCSIECSIWCSRWQISWDSLDEYWLRSCFLRKSAFAFHNTSYMLIIISFIHSRRQNQSSKGRPLRYGSGPDPLLRTLQPAKLETYQSFKSNTTMRKEQIAYKTKLSISCWKILYQISFLLTEYRWICFLANAWWLLLAIKISFDGFNLKTSTVRTGPVGMGRTRPVGMGRTRPVGMGQNLLGRQIFARIFRVGHVRSFLSVSILDVFIFKSELKVEKRHRHFVSL